MREQTETLDSGAKLRGFVATHKIKVVEMAPEVGASLTWLNQVLQGRGNPSDELKQRILAYLGESTGRVVQMNEVF